MISVLLADSHRGVLERLSERLSRETSITVVGQASNDEEVLAAVLALHPDVLVIDPGSSEDEGFLAVVKLIRLQAPEVKAIALAPYVDTFLNLELRKAGVAAVLTKGLDIEELIAAIRDVVASPGDLPAPLQG